MTTVLGAPIVGGRPNSAWLAIEGDLIVDVGDGQPPADARDVPGVVLVPGFIDLQVNGFGPVDLAVADPAGWDLLGTMLATHGVTTYCPTFVSSPRDAYDRYLTAARHAATTTACGGARAQVAGVHLEGPFLGGAPGAHDSAFLTGADPAWMGALLDRFPDLVRVVTLAPEADPGGATIHMLASRGVVPALGHSAATYDEAVAAIDAGAMLVTHLFNGMRPWHHREPNLAGAALADDRVTASLIADFVHVHPAVVRTACLAKTAIALVSDAVGVDAGHRGHVGVDEHDGAIYTLDGTLAGSSVTLDRALRNVVSLSIPLDRAVAMTSTIPATVLGLSDRGRLDPGRRADIVALDARDLTVAQVWVGGEEVLSPEMAPTTQSSVP